MAFRISKRAFTRIFGGYSPNFLKCTYTVRQNASTISHDCSPLSSKGPNNRSLGLYDSITFEEGNLAYLTVCLRGNGFSDTDIFKIVKQCPSIARTKVSKTLRVKLKFLSSIGLSRGDLLTFVLRNPFLLSSNFEKQVIPCYNYFKNLPMDDESLIKMLKDNPGILLTKVDKVIEPNVELLREIGIPYSFITSFIVQNHNAICRNHERFKISVEQAMAMGLDPRTKMFLYAVRVLCSLSKQTWDHKVKLFRSFGFSDDYIALAFRKQPYVMAISEKKIEKVMDFFLKELKWAPSDVANAPVILLMNFERRIVPRCRVMEILTEKGLLKNMTLSSFLKLTEEDFLVRFIQRHADLLPELMDVYGEGSSSLRKLALPLHVE